MRLRSGMSDRSGNEKVRHGYCGYCDVVSLSRKTVAL